MYQKYVVFEPNSGFTTSAMSGTSHVGIIQHHLWMFGRDDMPVVACICHIFRVSRYIFGICVYIYIVHIDIGMYLWWVVNVRWGRFASLLLLCERDLHYGICSGILNPNRPQTCTNSKLFAIGWDSIRLGWSETMHKQQPERQQYPYTPNSIWHCLKLKHVYISGSEGWCCSGGYSHHIWRVWENLGTDMYFCVDVLFRPFWSLVCFTQQGSMDPHDKFVRKGLRPQTILPYSAWSFVSTYWTMFFLPEYIYIYIYIYCT